MNHRNVRFLACSLGLWAILVPAAAFAQQRPGPRTARSDARRVNALARHLQIARDAQATVDQIGDYTFTFTKRERVDGELTEADSLAVKVRHEPFSVYARCLGPVKSPGQEVIYIDGANNGQAWAHTTGITGKLVGTLSLDPAGSMMMDGNRHPVTNIGMKNLIRNVIEDFEEYASVSDQLDPNVYLNAKLNGRPVICLEVTALEPLPNKNPRQRTRLYIDRELNVPVRLEAYEWPSRAGDKPLLVEEYEYTDLELNPGLADRDFDIDNPAYGF